MESPGEVTYRRCRSEMVPEQNPCVQKVLCSSFYYMYAEPSCPAVQLYAYNVMYMYICIHVHVHVVHVQCTCMHTCMFTYSWVQHSKNSNDRLFGHTDFARVPFLTYIFYRQLLLEIPFFGVNKRALKNSWSYGWFIRYAQTFDIFNPHNLKQKHNITHVNFTQNIHPNKIRVSKNFWS